MQNEASIYIFKCTAGYWLRYKEISRRDRYYCDKSLVSGYLTYTGHHIVYKPQARYNLLKVHYTRPTGPPRPAIKPIEGQVLLSIA